MTKSSKKTVGSLALESQKKDIDSDYIEMQREIHRGSKSEKSYEEEVWDCIDRGKGDTSISKDFYVVVLFKKERHLQNIVRQMFFYRQSCPSPEYDQTVYKYHREGDEVEYLWTVPNNVACIALVSDLQSGAIHHEHATLAHMAEAFMKGELDLYAKKLNKEFP